MALRGKLYRDKDKLRATRNAQRRRYYAKTANYTPRAWTDAEMGLLFNNDMTDTELSAYVGRSVSAIQKKRCVLNKSSSMQLENHAKIA